MSAVVPFHRDGEVADMRKATTRADMAFMERKQACDKALFEKKGRWLKFE